MKNNKKQGLKLKSKAKTQNSKSVGAKKSVSKPQVNKQVQQPVTIVRPQQLVKLAPPSKTKREQVKWWSKEKVAIALEDQGSTQIATVGSNLPFIGNRGIATVVKHRDYITALASGDHFRPVGGWERGFRVNPTRIAVPWLSRFAKGFSFFSVESFRVGYTPSCSMMHSGAIMLGYAHDPRMPAPCDIREMSLCSELEKGPVNSAHTLALKGGAMHTILRVDSYNTVVMPEQTSAGILFCTVHGAVDGDNNKYAGDLFFEYEFHFYYPRPYVDYCLTGGSDLNSILNKWIANAYSAGNNPDQAGVELLLQQLKLEALKTLRNSGRMRQNPFLTVGENGKQFVEMIQKSLPVLHMNSGKLICGGSETAVVHHGVRFNFTAPISIDMMGNQTFSTQGDNPYVTRYFGAPLVVHPNSTFALGWDNQFYESEPISWAATWAVSSDDEKTKRKTPSYVKDTGFETKLVLNVTEGDELYFEVPYHAPYMWFGWNSPLINGLPDRMTPGSNELAYDNGVQIRTNTPPDSSGLGTMTDPVKGNTPRVCGTAIPILEFKFLPRADPNKTKQYEQAVSKWETEKS